MTYVPDWPLIAEILKAGLPPVIALGVAWIAYQQWKTAKDKLALDLFERRLANYRAWSTALAAKFQEIMNSTDLDGRIASLRSDLIFLQHTSEARFLFGEETYSLIHRLVLKLEELEENPGNNPEFNGLQALYHRDRASLASVLDGYLLLDRISVSRPAKVERASKA